jgi:hypothetical protein
MSKDILIIKKYLHAYNFQLENNLIYKIINNLS